MKAVRCQVISVLVGTACLGGPPEDAAIQGVHNKVEVACTAGLDGAWFTADDEVHHYFITTTNEGGHITSRSWIDPGADRKAFTADDQRKDMESFVLAPDGRRVRSVFFGAPGQDGKWRTEDDIVQYTENYEYDGGSNLIRRLRMAGDKVTRIAVFSRDKTARRETGDVEYDSSGSDGKWGTADDGIEKYHSFHYDEAGRRVQSTECHVKHDGTGPDGKWFTGDDVVSSTKTHIYNVDGELVKELKALGRGPDEKWFTADDVLQYYTLYLRQPATENTVMMYK